jgi:AraC-like DNA-binding protein
MMLKPEASSANAPSLKNPANSGTAWLHRLRFLPQQFLENRTARYHFSVASISRQSNCLSSPFQQHSRLTTLSSRNRYLQDA